MIPEDTIKTSGAGGPNTRPTPTNLIEWVEQQALPLTVPARVTTTRQDNAPVPTSAVKSSHGSPMPLSQADDVVKTEKRVYDIATLHALREDAVRKNVELKVHPAALKGKLQSSLWYLLSSFAFWFSLGLLPVRESFLAN
jgi:hypothetical protein